MKIARFALLISMNWLKLLLNLLLLLSLNRTFAIDESSQNIFMQKDLAGLRAQKLRHDYNLNLERHCEIELEIGAIPLACYHFRPKSDWNGLDQLCSKAVLDSEVTLNDLKAKSQRYIPSINCKKHIKERITLLEYKQQSTFN